MDNSIKRKVSFEMGKSPDSKNDESIGINKVIDSFITSEEWDIDEKNRKQRNGHSKTKNNLPLPHFGHLPVTDVKPISIVQKRPQAVIRTIEKEETTREVPHLFHKK